MSVVNFLSKSFIALSVLGLTACGGGGGSDSSTSSSTPAVTSSGKAPVVSNPIADESAKVGENYNFEIPADTCTDADGDTISYSITRLGNGSGLSLVNFDTITGAPTRPGVASVTVTCTADSASASDEFFITITEDNIAPTVNAGVDQTVTAGDTVTLTAIATDSNTDGSIVSYSWQQEAADISVATITNSDQSVASFIAPDVDNTQTLTFTVQVTDNVGATSSDTLVIAVLSKNTPEVTVDFPLAFGETNGTEIDVFGAVNTKNGATLANVTINANGSSYEALIDDDGSSWRAANVGLTDVDSLTITATDSKGLIGTQEWSVSTDSATDISLANDIVDMALDIDNNRMFVQATGILVAHIKTYAINLTDGTQTELVVTDSDATFSSAQLFSFAFDKTNNQLLTGVNGTEASAVLATNLTTFERSVVSSDSIGTGPVLGLPTDIIFDDQGLTYLIDNTNHQVLSLDLATGNRTVVADGSASPQTISSPLSAIFNPTNDSLIVATNSFFGSPLQVVDTNSVNSVTEISGTSTSTVNDIAIDNAEQVIYFIDEDDNLTRYDLTSGSSTILINNIIDNTGIVSAGVGSIGMEFNEENNLLYITGKSKNTGTNVILVVDTVSGDYITL